MPYLLNIQINAMYLNIDWVSTSEFFGYIQAAIIHINCEKFGNIVEPEPQARTAHIDDNSRIRCQIGKFVLRSRDLGCAISDEMHKFWKCSEEMCNQPRCPRF
jgi:hypothetical protein